MKKNFTKAVLLALTFVSMGMFNSCKDHDDYDDLRLSLEILKNDMNAGLDEIIKAQQKDIKDLQDQLNAIKSCACTLTPDKVQEMIDAAIKEAISSGNNQVFVTEVQNIINQMGFQTEEEVKNAIAAYAKANPAGLSAEEVEQLISAATAQLATKEALDDAIKTLKDAMKTAEDALNGRLGELGDQVGELNSRAEILAAAINDINTAVIAAQSQAELAQKLAEENKLAIEGINETIAGFNDIIAAWGPKLEEALKNATDALTLAQNNYDQITSMQKQYEDLSAVLDSLANLNHEAYDDTELRNSVDSLANEMKEFATKEALRDVLTAAEIMHAQAMEYTKQVEEWAAEQFGDINDKLDDTNDKLDDTNDRLDDTNDKLDETVIKLGELEDFFKTLEEEVDALKDQIDEISEQVEKNTQNIKAMYGYLKKLITNITIQAVNNPVFGSVAFPWGIQSNILVGYYGESDVDVRFPTTRTANYIYKEYALTDKDAEMLGSSVESYNKFGQSVLVEETEGNAGKVYLTINPTNIDFSGTSFSLVNSQDEESPVKLGKLTKSDVTLKFGYTRAANNGFYEAPATFTEEDIPAYNIDKSLVFNNLKAIAKDVIDFRNGVNVKESANRLYNVFLELNGNLDAYGIKASWTAEGVEQSVYSKYAIATTAIQPLSYEFLYDMNIGSAINNRIPNLPTINPISDAILNDLIDFDKINEMLNIDFSGINFQIDPISVQIPAININFEEIKIDNIGELTAEVNIPNYVIDNTSGTPVLKPNGTTPKTVNVDATSLKTAIEKSINESLDKAGATLGKDIQDQLNNALDTQLNAAVANIEAGVNDLIQNQLASQINGQLQGIITDVKDQVTAGAGNIIDKANVFIDKLNVWSGRLNNFMTRTENFLNNVNTKLHVTMLYKGADGLLHQLSNSKAYPTVFTGEGAANVFATSYTGEVIAPAFKKFIGVTNVFKDGDSAQNGCADCKAALDAVNDGEYINEVFPGSRYGVAIENMKKGYTYEIFYSGLDYSGKISARKFYVTVK